MLNARMLRAYANLATWRFAWPLLQSFRFRAFATLRYTVCFRNWGRKFMRATYHPRVHKYALFLVLYAAVLLTAGALVTSEDAALAVPDWPLSYGTLNPPMIGGIAFEHSHRMIAAGLGFLIIILAYLLWRYEERRWMKWLGFAALG